MERLDAEGTLARLPIIILTAHRDPKGRDTSLARALLKKPLQASDLLAIVARFVPPPRR